MAVPTAAQVVEATEARDKETFALDAYMSRIAYMTQYRADLDKLDAFLDGSWVVEFPDGSTVIDSPKIENMVMSKIQDTGDLSGGPLPAIRVEPINERDETGASEREKAFQNYWQQSKLGLILPRLFMDLVGTGIAALRVWPNFGEKDRAKRLPQYKRIDPRHLLPPLDYAIEGHVRPHDIITHRKVKTRNLARDFPDKVNDIRAFAAKLAGPAKKGGSPIVVNTEEVVVIEYWGEDAIVHLAMLQDYPDSAVTLVNEYNESGICPVAVGVRPTPNGKIRGKVFSMMPQLAAENRLVTYVLTYADQMVFAPIFKKGNISNAEQFGPGAILDGDENSAISRVPPAQANPQLFQIISDLERHARTGGNLPAARAGQVSQSIGSGSFVESLMGGLTTEVQSLQKVVEYMLEDANDIAAKQDMAYCDAEKVARGVGKNGGFHLTYTPSQLFKKDTSSFVTYGAGAGLDKYNAEVRLDQRARGGYVSKRWVMEQMDGIDNVTQEETRILQEAALSAFVQGMLAKAQTGDLTAVAAFYQTLKKPEAAKDPLVAIELLSQEQLAPQAAGPAQAPGPSPQPATAQQTQAALQSGGLAGTEGSVLAQQGPGMMPPLAQLLGRAAG